MVIRCLSLVSVLLPLAAAAQDASNTRITITGRSEPGAAVAGFGNVPLAEAPLQALVVGGERLTDRGIQTIGGLTRLDASIGEAYDAPGYWSIIQVRGYTLDNRYNYRRDGLPINAETALLLSNKERLEVLKGASGIQAGSSAPGGLVNLVVDRPRAGQREALLQWRQSGSLLGAVDVGDRQGAFGWRVNAAYERLQPRLRDSDGRSALLALAGDWQPTPGTLIEAEVESSRFRQPSMVGYSLLGDRVPDVHAIDIDRNLNHQPWGQPVVMNGNTASLRWQQQLTPGWRLRVHGMLQRLTSDDRTAFPYGVYDAATYTCTRYCDRYAPDGSFTYWQFVSDGEHRRSGAVEAAVSGSVRTGLVEHAVEAGVLQTRFKARFGEQIFDIAGPGNIDGSLVTPPAPGFTDANTDRDERTTEAFARDAMRWGATSLWAGLRQNWLHRESRRTSPDSNASLRQTAYGQRVTTPWIALSQQLTPSTLVYASWGRGVESAVAPNRPIYANAGEPLPTLKSRQTEAGIKFAGTAASATLTLFAIDRPLAADVCDANGGTGCRYAIDGGDRHRGIEATAGWRAGPLDLQASTMLLDAERHGSTVAARNGTRPVNVPVRTLRLAAGWHVAPGLELQAAGRADGDRVVLPDDSGKRIGGWAAIDMGARWEQRLGDVAGRQTVLVWRLGVDNVLDRRAWKESPYQFSHAYLYPLPPRTWRASLQAGF